MASRAFGPDSIVGLRLGHYVVVTRIGAGGMGEVYRARDEHLDRDVAIKVSKKKPCSPSIRTIPLSDTSVKPSRASEPRQAC
jgi:serine/threonine protein kinase